MESTGYRLESEEEPRTWDELQREMLEIARNIICEKRKPDYSKVTREVTKRFSNRDWQ